jgi:hypothetical protein
MLLCGFPSIEKAYVTAFTLSDSPRTVLCPRQVPPHGVMTLFNTVQHDARTFVGPGDTVSGPYPERQYLCFSRRITA